MIDPTHLRIGNVIHQMDDGIGSYDTIIEIQREYAICQDYGLMYWTFVNPIPLTPEWLERIELPEGFKEDFEINTFKNSKGIITDYWISKRTYCQECYDTIIVSELKYLHTLQNVVHLLTGQELTIKP